MKKIIIATLLSLFVVAPAIAADKNKSMSKKSIGVSYGLDADGVIGIHGEFDISSHVSNKPVTAQVFWKNYSESHFVSGVGTYQYSYNGFGVAAIYDFGSVVKQDKKIKPYVGLGIYALQNKLSGPSTGFNVSADSGGLYITGGIRYAVMPDVAVDLNLNNIGGLTFGANFLF